MSLQLWQYAAAHRYLLEEVRRQTGIEEPVAIHLDQFEEPLFKASRRGPLLPLDGVLVRDWDPENRKVNSGVQFGLRLYEIEGIRFARVHFHYSEWLKDGGYNFVAVARTDYRRLYRAALRCRRDEQPQATPPVLPREQLELLWNNTVGYLESDRFQRIRAYGGRPKRGVLLTGDPGNGKTMACRWIWEACRRRGWEYQLVTPDTYRQARRCGTVKELFTVDRRGIVFFDDMDLALRDRETTKETDDQAVFLSSMDGLTSNEGVVFVFTTNCALDLIDRAFRRPGRLDLVLHFQAPDVDLRRRMIDRWHADIRAGIDVDLAVRSTAGLSFAELDEVKNLLVMHHADSGRWNLHLAMQQFAVNRSELSNRAVRRVGFAGRLPASGNGNGAEPR